MAIPDLVLLHAPSVYDFRKLPILFGPVADLVPSTPVFEMYPIGFANIGAYLERAGYRVRIVNLAVRMLKDPQFDAERAIQRLQARVFGIDLHWLPHAHGALEVAALVKKHHPQAKVIIGGIASSYFWRDILDYPSVDYVMRGDSTEEPLRQLLDCVRRGEPPSDVPNLAWRDDGGAVHENPLSHVPATLDGLMAGSYEFVIRSTLRYRDLTSHIPFEGWTDYPITAVLTCRGCTHNCGFCSGSAHSYRQYCGRDAPAYRTPEAVAADVAAVQRFSAGPIFILGDLRQPGEDYAHRLLGLLERLRPKNQLILELFRPADAAYLRRVGEACPNFCLEFSPESHDPVIRRATGKPYANAAIEATVDAALAAGCARLDLFFLIGLSQQTPQSALDTVAYCGELMARDPVRHRVAPFIAPLAPFLDPGSPSFDNAEASGYRILFQRLEDYRAALRSPCWKQMLNYETAWMTRDDVATTTYRAARELNRLKHQAGFVATAAFAATAARIDAAEAAVAAIDAIMADADDEARVAKLWRLKANDDWLRLGTTCDKAELELATGRTKLRPLSALQALLSR